MLVKKNQRLDVSRQNAKAEMWIPSLYYQFNIDIVMLLYIISIVMTCSSK